VKKCLLICFLVVSLVLTTLPAGATSSAVFKIIPPTELPKAGDEFEVTVELSNNPGFCAIQFTLAYDRNMLECVEVESGEVLDGALTVTNPNGNLGAIVSAACLDALSENGTVATVYFVAKEDIADFNLVLKDVILSDGNLKDLPFEVDRVTFEEEIPSLPEHTEEPEDIYEEEESLTPSDDNDFPYEEEIEETPVTAPNASVEQEEGIIPEPTPEAGTVQESITEHQFPDMKDHWAESFVSEAARLGLFKGGADGNFNPDSNVTRAQFVTVLYRMAGSPTVEAELPFTDIDNQIPEFKSAISWGYANGYINGTSDTTFDPDGTLTREAGMKILHFYSGGKIGAEIQLYGVYDGLFKDSANISSWAKKSVYWGIYYKLISGTSVDSLSPQGTATRAQLAKILVNYLNIDK